MTIDNDVELIKRFQDGDRSAFEELLLRHQGRVYNLCRYMIRDVEDARDAAQDTFIKAYRNLPDYVPDASFLTWLRRIAVNTCLDYHKKSRPEALEDSVAENLASPEASPERLYQSRETGRLIEAALQKLPKKLKAAIVLREIEGLSYEEIAEALPASVGTVKSRISRAREELRRLLFKKL